MTNTAAELSLPPARPEAFADRARCFHCGDVCRGVRTESAGKTFCCAGCQMVFELLTENGLQEFYALGESAGVKVKSPSNFANFQFLDEPTVRGDALIDFLGLTTLEPRAFPGAKRYIAPLVSGCWRTCSASGLALPLRGSISEKRRSG